MPNPAVTLTIAADHSKSDRAFKETHEGLDELARAADKDAARIEGAFKDATRGTQRFSEDTSRSFDRVGESFDDAETRAQGFRDGVTGVQDSMGSLSAFAAGDFQEGLLLAGSGIADLSSSMANSIIPAVKAAVTRLGVLRLALLGVAAAAVVGVGAWLLYKNATRDTTEQAEDMKKAVDVLVRSRVFSGELRREFGSGADAVDNFREKLELARAVTDEGIFGNLARRGFGSSERQDAIKDIERLDEALASAVESGTSVAEIFAAMDDAGQGANFQFALSNGLLPEFARVAGDAQEQGELLADAVETTATEYRIASRELKTFADLLRAQTSPIFGFVNAQNQVESAQAALNAAVGEFGPNSKEAQDAAFELAQAELGLVDATAALESVNQEELIPTLRQLVEDGRLSQQGFDLLAGALSNAKNKANDLDGTRVRVNIDQVIRQQFSGPAGRAFGGASFSVLHDGGVVPGPRGEEVAAILQAGERVIPLDQAGDQRMVLELRSSGSRVDDLLIEILQQSIAVRGGDVQVVLGR